MAQHLALLKQLAEEEFFYCQQHGKVKTPDNEVPVRAVPEAREHPYNEDVEHLTAKAYSVSAKRDIQIIAEPGAEGHMPTAPELGDAAADIRIIEVFDKIEGKDLAESYRHIAVTGEIEIQLKHIRNNVHPEEQHGLIVRCAENADKLAEAVGYKHLFCKSNGKSAYTVSRFLKGVLSVLKLCRYVHVSYDGTRNKLGEHGNVAGKVKGIALGGSTTVNVHGVADDLEGVEAYTNGQSNVHEGDIHAGYKIYVINKEVCVFVINKEGSADDNGNYHKQLAELNVLPVFFHKQTENVAKRYGNDHKKNKARLAP